MSAAELSAVRDSKDMGSDGPAAEPLVPADYVEGFAKARAIDPERAATYIAHTHIGDPLADAAIDQLGELPRHDADRLLKAAIERPEDHSLRDAPPALRALIDEWATPPAWVDLRSLDPATRMFYQDPYVGLAAMLSGVLVEGFSTNIAKSFFITGRLRDQGVRRLRQNNRHLMEILLPDGMSDRGDGWKLSVRIRMVHARVRGLLQASDDWETASWGSPLSAAHLGFAITAFSARMLYHMKQLGIKATGQQRSSFMAVWRYSGHLMGIPDTILFHDEQDAMNWFEIGGLCEPRNTTESVMMANALINAGPLIADITDPHERRKLARYIYRLSRALIGNEMADELKYPRGNNFGVLPWFRAQRRYHRFMSERLPKLTRESSFVAFNQMLGASALSELDITYKLPDHVYAERSSSW